MRYVVWARGRCYRRPGGKLTVHAEQQLLRRFDLSTGQVYLQRTGKVRFTVTIGRRCVYIGDTGEVRISDNYPDIMHIFIWRTPCFRPDEPWVPIVEVVDRRSEAVVKWD